MSLFIESDATAAIGMVRRQGLGAVRHLATADLWIQQRVLAKEIKVGKLGTKDNTADLLTKILPPDQLRLLLKQIGFEFTEGRAGIAPVRAEVGEGCAAPPV